MKIHENLSLENIVGEIWRDCVGFEDYYQVSNFGRVKSKNSERLYPLNKLNPKSSLRRKAYFEKILKQRYKNGYLQVPLYDGA